MEYARPATAADVPALEVLCGTALREMAGQRGGDFLTSPKSLPELVEGAAGDDDRIVVVGLTDEAEVGMAAAHCDRTRPQAIGVIDAIYVEPPARMVGVGEAMIELIVAWCARRGCAGVDAPALPGSRPAKAFFEDNGFVTRLLIMHHPIPPSGG